MPATAAAADGRGPPLPLSAKNFHPAFASALTWKSSASSFVSAQLDPHHPPPCFRQTGLAAFPSTWDIGDIATETRCRLSGGADSTEFIIASSGSAVSGRAGSGSITQSCHLQALSNCCERTACPEAIKPRSLKSRDAKLDSSDMRCARGLSPGGATRVPGCGRRRDPSLISDAAWGHSLGSASMP